MKKRSTTAPASGEHLSILRSSTGTAAATLASRVLGLIRVKIEALTLGGGELASGWFLAFAVPNLFRRILGEGALGTALIPVIAEAEKEGGPERVRRELGVIFAALGAILALIVIVVSGAAMLGRFMTAGAAAGLGSSERMRIFLRLLPLLMPYAFFICLVGAIGAVLNYLRVFVLPALGALLLNIILIVTLAFAYCRFNGGIGEIAAFLPKLASAVLLSGALQFILMVLLLRHYGRMPIFRRDAAVNPREILGRLFRLALPGMIGGSALQVSFLVDRGVAVWLGRQAVPALTYVDRLVDLPIGIFAISLGAVLMSSMGRAAAAGKHDELAGDLVFGLRHVYFICIPMAAGVVLFHEPMLKLLCLGGNYTMQDLDAARTVAIFYGAGIPFFCSIKAILPAFYARKHMIEPLIASLIAIAVNIVLNLALMIPLRQGGIALATVIASVVNNTILLSLLRRQGFRLPGGELAKVFLRSLLTAAVTGGAAALIFQRLHPEGSCSWLTELLLFCGAGAAFAAAYWGSNLLLRAAEPREFFSMMRRRRKPAAK